MIKHFMLICIIAAFSAMASSVYSQQNEKSSNRHGIHQTDAQIIKKAILVLKEQLFRDREILNINMRVKAQWHQNGASIVILPLDNNGVWFQDGLVYYIGMRFDGPPEYDLYARGGCRSYIVENFMEQINKKNSDSTSLINFIQKDLIITLEYADGSKVIFDAYYTDIGKNLPFWRKEFDPGNTNPFYNK